MTAKSLNDDYGYLKSTAEAFYPDDPAAFRAIYQIPNTRAPQYRLEGIASMTDAQVSRLAEVLQMAVIHNPSNINGLWAAVCEQGRREVEDV